jgi:NB-ARC domain
MPKRRARAAGPAVQVAGDAKGVVGIVYGNVTMNIGGEERTIPFLAPPRPPYALVGREELLRSIKERLFAGENRDAAGLTVLPGAGKSALAVHLAHDEDVLEHFPDGVLWAGLGRHPDLLAVLGQWAAALGVQKEELEALQTVGERQNAIRSRIGDRKMLVVVDDAWDTDAALTFLLDCRHCAHLVTTRVRGVARDFAAEGVTELEELSEDDCLALLRQIAPRAVKENEGAIRGLVREVGGLPLAMVLIGRRLAKESEGGDPERIAAATSKLRDRIERLKLDLPMTALARSPGVDEQASPTLLEIIRVSDEALDNDAKYALLALSVFRPKPGTFSTKAARTVADVAPESIYALDDLGLVEGVGKGDYTMQRTIADYARAQLSDEQAKRLHRKAAAFYARQLRDFDEASGGNTSYERNCRFEDPAWQAAKVEWQWHRMNMSDRKTARVDLARAYFDAFWWWGAYTDYPFCRRLLDGTGLEGAEEDQEWLALLLRFHDAYPTWHEHRGEGDWDAVAAALAELRKVLGVDGDLAKLKGELRHLRAMTDLFLADAHRYRDVEDRETDRLYSEAYELLKSSDDDAWILGWILQHQAETCAARGDADDARDKSMQSRERALVEGDHELLACNHELLANLLWDQNDFEGALRERTKSLFEVYRFQGFPKTPDFYTLAFWDDALEEALDWLAQVRKRSGAAAAVTACVGLHDMWAPELWAAWAAPSGQAAPADLAEPPTDGPRDRLHAVLFPDLRADADPRRLEELAALLETMSSRFA